MDPISMSNLAGIGFKGVTALVGALAGANQKSPEQIRMEEEYNRKAYGQLGRMQEANQMLSPEAAARSARAAVTGTRDAAVSAALDSAAAGMANQGGVSIGGDASALSAAQAAAAPYAQQEASIAQNQMSQEMAKVGQGVDIGNSIASLSNHVSYMNQQQQNPILNALSGMLGGANAGAGIMGLLDDKNSSLNTGKTEQGTMEQTEPLLRNVLAGGLPAATEVAQSVVAPSPTTTTVPPGVTDPTALAEQALQTGTDALQPLTPIANPFLQQTPGGKAASAVKMAGAPGTSKPNIKTLFGLTDLFGGGNNIGKLFSSM